MHSKVPLTLVDFLTGCLADVAERDSGAEIMQKSSTIDSPTYLYWRMPES